MSNSALLKSSVAKKYMMALTGLFLCLFLVGHLAGNLQLIFKTGAEGQLAFNKYAYFMTHNPAVKILSYLTYASIIFHAIDGILLTMKNKAARPQGYAYSKPNENSKWYSRSMALLGSVILIFIVSHMYSFWGQMHFGDVPLHATEQEITFSGLPTGDTTMYAVSFPTVDGKDVSVDIQDSASYSVEGNTLISHLNRPIQGGIMQSMDIEYEGYKDLHSMVYAFFGKEPVYSYRKFEVNKHGMWMALLYAVAMVVLLFHLLHGFSSAFQSLGLRTGKYAPIINKVGVFFSVVVSIGFAIIPLIIHFS